MKLQRTSKILLFLIILVLPNISFSYSLQILDQNKSKVLLKKEISSSENFCYSSFCCDFYVIKTKLKRIKNHALSCYNKKLKEMKFISTNICDSADTINIEADVVGALINITDGKTNHLVTVSCD